MQTSTQNLYLGIDTRLPRLGNQIIGLPFLAL
jgi:hypothetical protein